MLDVARYGPGDPVGPDADLYLQDVAAFADGPLVAGWGAWGQDACGGLVRDRAAAVRALLGVRMVCLGKTKAGHPRHPLYVAASAPLIPLEA